MAASSDRPRTKRQFKPVAQPSILSYFQSSSSPTSTSTATAPLRNTNNPSFPATRHRSSSYPQTQYPHHDTTASQLAPLPAAVQASLLSVGMRVRKSVPEGYKTGKEMAPPYSTTDDVPMSRTNSNGFSTQRKRSDAISISRVQHAWLQADVPSMGAGTAADPTSYCGIHNIGGYAAQPFPYLAIPPFAQSGLSAEPGSDMDISVSEEEEERFGLLPRSSQDSFTSTSTNLTTASTISTASVSPSSFQYHEFPPHHHHHHRINRKRTFQDTDPDPDPADHESSDPPFLVPLEQPRPLSSLSSSAYPIQYPISHTAMPNLDPSSYRMIARPKTRRKGSGYGGVSGSSDADGAGTSDGGGVQIGDSDPDFEEAEFLMPLSDAAGVDMDVDMEGL